MNLMFLLWLINLINRRAFPDIQQKCWKIECEASETADWCPVLFCHQPTPQVSHGVFKYEIWIEAAQYLLGTNEQWPIMLHNWLHIHLFISLLEYTHTRVTLVKSSHGPLLLKQTFLVIACKTNNSLYSL